MKHFFKKIVKRKKRRFLKRRKERKNKRREKKNFFKRRRILIGIIVRNRIVSGIQENKKEKNRAGKYFTLFSRRMATRY